MRHPLADLSKLAARAPHNVTLLVMVAACLEKKVVVLARGGPQDWLPFRAAAQPADGFDDGCDPADEYGEDDAGAPPAAHEE
jgi:hypothetical protein